jgi:hypothetical protein
VADLADACSDEDEELQAMALLGAYADDAARRRILFTRIEAGCQAVISSYVKYRGGLQEIRVFPIPLHSSFNPDLIDEKRFVQLFRFTHSQMDRVVLALISAGVPEVIKTCERDACSLMQGLCMLCMKFAWPTRLGTMVRLFRSSTARMSRVICQLRRILYEKFSRSLQSPRTLTIQELKRFGCAIWKRSGVCTHTFGFIDGTVRPISKPGFFQQAVYNGKDRVHALKYQAVVTPDGMFLQLCGPWPGSRHDMHMLNQSRLKEYIQSLPRDESGRPFVVYADQGYAEWPGVIETPFFDGAVNAMHEIHNQAMASSRIAVEWAFGDLVSQWASLDMKRLQQLLGRRKIGQVYLVSGLLSNFLNCFQPNKCAQYFGVEPPSVEVYARSLQRDM